MNTSRLVTVLSALYGKLLVVVCVGFVTAEVVTSRIPLHFYEGFFTFLYGVSLIFLGLSFTRLARGSRAEPRCAADVKDEEVAISSGGCGHQGGQSRPATLERRRRSSFMVENGQGFGSLFLRVGTLAFGLATMVYNGLEFGSFFEIPLNSPCYKILRGINPLLQMLYTFVQMYCIFMLTKSVVAKFRPWTRFGLMHLVSTNLGVWIRTLVRDSTQEISAVMEFRSSLANDNSFTLSFSNTSEMEPSESDQEANDNSTCHRHDVMGSVVSASAPHLYPFLIQFSLVGAATIYVMWRSTGRYHLQPQSTTPCITGGPSSLAFIKVDCIGASRGLFVGLFALVANIICLIVFFVLVGHARFHRVAVYLAHIAHDALLFLSAIATLVALLRLRGTLSPSISRKVRTRDRDRDRLESLLLRASTFGVFVYAVFGVLAGAAGASSSESAMLLAATSALTIAQAALQSLLLTEVPPPAHPITQRSSHNPHPGRQAVTLLLICNVTLWVVVTFETQQNRATLIQSEVFGKVLWAAVQRATLPLCVFYRFLSTVLLADLCKALYASSSSK